MKHGTKKKSISSIKKLDDGRNYLKQNAGAKIRVVGSWANIRTFTVYFYQKSYDTKREI